MEVLGFLGRDDRSERVLYASCAWCFVITILEAQDPFPTPVDIPSSATEIEKQATRPGTTRTSERRDGTPKNRRRERTIVMKTQVVVGVFVLLAAATCLHGGDDEEKRGSWCDVGGSWYADAGTAPWIATFSETSFTRGLLVTQWSGGNGEWLGYCAGSVAVSNGLGSWARKGPRTLLYTIITFSLDADGEVVCIWKSSGRITFDAGCKSGVQSGSTELFDPGSNPFEDEPFYWLPRGGDTAFTRMTVDPCRY